VLITGAGGFVGANLVRRALRDGHTVHVLLRPGARPWRLARIDEPLHVHAASLDDRDAVARAVRDARPQWVFHLAAYGAYASQTDVQRMTATNLLGCVNLLDACASTGVEALVQSGSSSEYGYKDHPAREDERIDPHSAYAITKAAATHYGRFIARERDVNVVTVRLYSAYGPYEEPTRLLPTLVVHGLKGRLPPLVSPATGRDFVYVDEVVEGLLRVAAAPAIPRGTIYNLASGVQTTIADVVALVRRLLDVREEPAWDSMERRPWDTDVWVGSGTALEHALGWRPRVTVEAGLSGLIRWFRERPDRIVFYEREQARGSDRS
jgi:dolichol-phosphate mannosyltransferase